MAVRRELVFDEVHKKLKIHDFDDIYDDIKELEKNMLSNKNTITKRIPQSCGTRFVALICVL